MNTERISGKLSGLPIEELSFSTKFQTRRDGIIKGYEFVMGFFQMIHKGSNTVEKWAEATGELSNHWISAQALQGKLQFRHQDFAEALLKYVLGHQIMQRQDGPVHKGLFRGFGRVLLEDSTCVKLPACLAKFFPGSFSRSGPGATARIQLCLDLLSGQYTHLELQSYRDNDQKFAGHILGLLSPGDLVIRDLGYAVLGVLRQIMEHKAFFLSRLRYGANVYDPKSGQEIDLLKKLRSLRRRGNSVLDLEVLVGKEEQLPVRLTALLAPPQVAQVRRRKAENDRNKKSNHSKEYMEMLGWTIFITNVPKEVWTPQEIMTAYGCRWHIEIIFKCWKSKFDFAHLFNNKRSMTPARAVISFYLLLTWLTLFFARWYYDMMVLVFKKRAKWLSPIKFADFVKTRFEQLYSAENLDQFVAGAARYYCYSKRRGKPNLIEKIYLLNLS